MEQKQEMHDVVEMLLSRMRDYPEDFVRTPTESINEYRPATKWERALGMVFEVASPHEREALEIRVAEAKRAVYMGAALKTIMSDGEPENSGITFHSGGQEKYRIDANGAFGLGTSTVPIFSRAQQTQNSIHDNLMNTGLFK